MNNQPLVSILSPCYNVEKFLPQCLETILGQTYHNLQVVLVDDGSRDGTWNVMQQYAAKDNRIEIYHQENQGVAITRNNLLDKVKGDLVLFVDSDDWVELTMVEALVQIQQQSGADMVVCGMVKNDQTPNLHDRSYTPYNQDQIVKAFLEHTWLNGSLCNKLVKTSLLHNERFRSGISYGEDALFCWHLLQHVKSVAVCKQQLYHYRMNETSLSHISYDERKMSGHIVWEIIADEAKKFWPHYTEIAEANFAISDMWQLYYARQSNYPLDNNILQFQTNVRTHLLMIYRSGLINYKKMLFAIMAAFSYKLCKVLIK